MRLTMTRQLRRGTFSLDGPVDGHIVAYHLTSSRAMIPGAFHPQDLDRAVVHFEGIVEGKSRRQLSAAVSPRLSASRISLASRNSVLR